MSKPNDLTLDEDTIDEIEKTNILLDKPEYSSEDIRYMVRNLPNTELYNIFNFGISVLSKEARDYFQRHNPIALIPKTDPERQEKIITLLLNPNFSYEKSLVLKELSQIPFPDSELQNLYEKYKDRDILDLAIQNTNMEGNSFGLYMANILYHAILINDTSVIDLLLSKYPNRIDLLHVYKKGFVENHPEISQRVVDLGFVAPKQTQGRRKCEIVRLNCNDMTHRERIELFRQLDLDQRDYFVFIYPLRNNCASDSQFFLIAHDENIICGSMFVEHTDENNYYVYSFATRTLMDPAYSGIGKQLIDVLKREAKENGIDRIVLSPLSTAIDFYKKMGFVFDLDLIDMYFKII